MTARHWPATGPPLAATIRHHPPLPTHTGTPPPSHGATARHWPATGLPQALYLLGFIKREAVQAKIASWTEYDHVVNHITMGPIDRLGWSFLARYHLGLQRVPMVGASVVGGILSCTRLEAMKVFWHTNLPIVGADFAPPCGPFMVSLFVYAVFLIRARSATMHSTWSHELSPEMEEQNEAARDTDSHQPTSAEMRATYGDGGDDDGDSEEELAALDVAQEASDAAAAVAAVAAFEAAESAHRYTAEQLAGVAAARVAQAEAEAAEAAAAAAAAAGADVVVVEPPLPANSGWAHYT